MHDIWQLFESEGVRPSHDWSSLVFIEVYANGTFANRVAEDPLPQPLGYIFVIEPERQDPKLKLPGGHKQHTEHPFQTAMREMEGETGLKAPNNSLFYVNSEWRHIPPPGHSHWSILFLARIEESEVPWMNSLHVENEGEIPKYLDRDAFLRALDAREILLPHFRRLRDTNLLLCK